ncbi:hypothetical protein C8U37_104140 [Trichococcus patagoniensis]|uniref:Secreted protein n=1 Tax=Trichococcus patagoniensis TaxID=382641 RepID=A0A2T5INW5_9LACT|nr:hypothetical protein [Trichococcus patagoniensis]PTQ85503.1 hypothetical protein C8U37_104140 [Trichococcus patagoniensis]
MNKTRIMTILSVAGLFVGGAAPVLAASDSAAQNGTATQEQIKSGECTNEGAKKQGNEEATMKRAREKSGTCDGTGTQAKQENKQNATGEADGDGNQYGAAETDATDNDGQNGVRDQSCQAE